MKKIFSALLILFMLISSLTLTAAADGASVSVSDAAGFSAALGTVADGGVITLTGKVAVSSDFKWSAHNKSITVTGGTLDLSAVTDLVFGDDVCFENTTVVFKDGGNVYANGHALTVKSSATVTNTANLYGGSKGGTLNSSTSLHIESGNYYKIFGGSNGGTVNGDTYVYVGGNTNTSCDWTDHNGTYTIYGGGNGCKINGNTYVTVEGSAKANYVFGGSMGSGSTISGRSNLNFGGSAKAMSLYGASNGVNTGNDATLIMTGGEIQQMFGGCQGASLSKSSGEVDVSVKA